MKKRIYLIAAIALLASCADNGKESFYIDELAVDTENCFAEGSYVQGVELSAANKVKVPYEGASGGTAVFSAPEENGMFISEQKLELEKGSGEVLLNVSGTPLACERTFLQLNVDYKGKKYLSSVEITILEDQDPSGTIVFDFDKISVNGLTEEMEIPFSVKPTMASVSETSETIDGLRVVITSDPAKGTGTVALKPAANFIGGTLELTASFGARQKQTRTVSLSAFNAGNGSKDAPYELASASDAAKLEFGLASYFKLKSDIDLGSSWTPVGTSLRPFSGGLDGDGHTVTLNIDRQKEDHVALFAYVSAEAEIKNLTLAGSVKGKDYVAAAASESEVALDVNTSAVQVEGSNYVASAVASGAGKDAQVIEFGEVPQFVNIPMGQNSYSENLGIRTKGVSVSFEPGTTGTNWNYNGESGNFTVEKSAGFNAGEVSFTAKLNENVKAYPRTLSVTSKSMYESGSGTEKDPYVVIDADQFTATVHNCATSYIRLDADIVLDSWESIENFSGTIDGNNHTVTGLDAPFAKTLSGSVRNIYFKDIDITAGTTNCGGVANTLTGSIRGVAVSGKLAAPVKASSGDTGLSPMAGQSSGSAVIDNCYVNVETIIEGTNFAFGGLTGVIKATDNVTLSNSTVAGKVSSSVNATKIGGVLGRKTNTNQNSKDKITGCLVSTEIAVSGSGSNMIGGIFGALQGATVSGDYVGGITIEKSAFTGKVSGGNAIGGIGGVCCSVRDCYVSGTVQATSVTSSSTAAAAGISAAVKGDVTRCVVNQSRITGGAKGSSFTAGIVNVKNGNAPKATSCYVMNTAIEAKGFAIYGTSNADITAGNNYRWGIKYASDDSAYVPKSEDNFGQDGIEKNMKQADFESLGYDFSTVWKWDDTTGAPMLAKVGCDDDIIKL